MKYVNMHEVVYDKNEVAFPGLGNCHGVVYVTSAGMFAWHLAGLAMGDYYSEIEKFIRCGNKNTGTIPVALLGACPTNRGTNKTELTDLAKAIGYKGEIRIYQWDLTAKGWKTTYVVVQRLPGSQQAVSIGEFDQSEETTGPNPYGFDEQMVIKKFVGGENKIGAKGRIAERVIIGYDHKTDLTKIDPTAVFIV